MKRMAMVLAAIVLVVCVALVSVACMRTTVQTGETQYYLNYGSVYALAEAAGYTGTLEELIEMFKGENAYQLAVAAGYTGTEEQWLQTLVGAAGKDGTKVSIGAGDHWFLDDVDTGVVAVGRDGKDAEVEIDEDGYWVINGRRTEYKVEGGSCQHEYGDWMVLRSASCTVDGVQIRVCNLCGNVAGEISTAYGHTVEDIPATNPTCTSAGHTHGAWCPVCEAVIEPYESIDALGHNFGANDVCTRCGQYRDNQWLHVGTYQTVSGTIPEDFKIGLIVLHDENDPYDREFIGSMLATKAMLGLSDDQVIIETNTPESSECMDAIGRLVYQGCDVVIADSYGHEDYMIQAAKINPAVLFGTATGEKAHQEQLPNYINAYASVYMGWYIAGAIAGDYLNFLYSSGKFRAGEEIKVGFVATYNYAEVVSAYSAWYLGIKAVVTDFEPTMEVYCTGSWNDEEAEKAAANALIDNGCTIIASYSPGLGVKKVCEQRAVYYVSHGMDPNAEYNSYHITSVRINWQSFYRYMIDAAVAGKAIGYDYVGTAQTGSVELYLTSFLRNLNWNTDNVRELLLYTPENKLFLTENFTVNGEHLTSYLANVDYDSNFTPDTEVIVDGAFLESYFRSAPYFDLLIDGIDIVHVEY